MTTITCPECGAQNSITAIDVPGDCPVSCSRCHASLGTWQEATGSVKSDEQTGAARLARLERKRKALRQQ